MIPIRPAFADWEKNHKSWVSGDGSCGGSRSGSGSRGGGGSGGGGDNGMVLVSPLTLYRPSATVLFHFVLKLIFSENKETLENS